MEVGRLNKHATILALSPELLPQVIGFAWLAIKAKEDADPGMPTGLRSPARVSIRGRYNPKLMQGRYLAYSGRLFFITSARDPLGDKSELRVTADEFVGEQGLCRRAGQPDVACRIQLNYEAPYLDVDGQATSYRIRGEVALIETGRVQVDDQFAVGAEVYNVIAYDESSDDGVVRALWLERL